MHVEQEDNPRGVLLCAGEPVEPVLYGQATGSFTGTVTDNAGAVISGATVRITSEGTGLTRETKTDDSGRYLIPLLPVSFYTIQVQAPGFGSVEQKQSACKSTSSANSISTSSPRQSVPAWR